MRVCNKCGDEKPLTEFKAVDGGRLRTLACKACISAAEQSRRWAAGVKPRVAYDEPEGFRFCRKCNELKALDQFATTGRSEKTRIQGWCKDCVNATQIAKSRAAGVDERKLTEIREDEKKCGHCANWLPFSAFALSVRGRGGLNAYCISCAKERFYRKEDRRVNTAKWRVNNRERHLAQHRVRMHEYNHKKKVSADGTVTDAFLKSLYGTERCFYCADVTPESQRTADHKTPLSKEGTHSASNLCMACFTCNSSKRDLTAVEYLKLMIQKEEK